MKSNTKPEGGGCFPTGSSAAQRRGCAEAGPPASAALRPLGGAGGEQLKDDLEASGSTRPGRCGAGAVGEPRAFRWWEGSALQMCRLQTALEFGWEPGWEMGKLHYTAVLGTGSCRWGLMHGTAPAPGDSSVPVLPSPVMPSAAGCSVWVTTSRSSRTAFSKPKDVSPQCVTLHRDISAPAGLSRGGCGLQAGAALPTSFPLARAPPSRSEALCGACTGPPALPRPPAASCAAASTLMCIMT